MSAASETPPPEQATDSSDDDWKSSAGEFFASRLELFRLEARDAGRQTARRLGLVAFAAGCAFLCWALVMAGLVGLLAAAIPSLPWHLVALALGGLHLLAAVIALAILRQSSGQAFPLTRSELLKDREWLDRILHKTPKAPR